MGRVSFFLENEPFALGIAKGSFVLCGANKCMVILLLNVARIQPTKAELSPIVGFCALFPTFIQWRFPKLTPCSP